MSHFFTTCTSKLMLFMENSVFFKFINGILSFFCRLFSGSILISLVSKETDSEFLNNSAIYRLIKWFFSLFKKFGNWFLIDAFEGSVFIKTYKSIPSFLLGIKSSFIGFGVLVGVVCYLIVDGFFGSYVISACVSIFAVLLIIVNKDFYSLILGSYTYKFVSDITGVRLPTNRHTSKTTLSAFFSIILGIILGTSFVYLQWFYVLAGFIGLCGALIVVAYPYIGILGIVALAPFIPTMAIAGLIIAVTACMFIKIMINRKTKFTLEILGFWIFIFIFIGLFKGITSFHPSTSIKIAFLTSLFMWFYFIILCLVNTRKKWETLILVFCMSACVTGLYGFYQKFSGKVDMTWVDKELFEGLKLRVFSTFGNPNVYGEYLLIAIPICLASAYFTNKWIMKIFYLVTGVLLTLNLAFTYSRGCYLAIALAALVFILFIEKRLIAFFSTGLFLVPFILPPTMLERITSITNFSDSSTSYRIMIWQSTIRIIKAFWFSGVGQGIDAYNAVYPLYAFNTISAPHSHNLFMQIFVETGIIGIGVFLTIIFCLFKTLVPFFYKTNESRNKVFAAAFMAMMVGFMLQGMFDYSFYNYKVFLMFFVSLGLAVSFAKNFEEKGKVILFD